LYQVDFTTRQRVSFASTVCLIAGMLMLLTALLGVSWRMFKLVPKNVKDAMPVGLGLMLGAAPCNMRGATCSTQFVTCSMRRAA
jgi:xanthine/uracil/vitamin C permease (AzgA family)